MSKCEICLKSSYVSICSYRCEQIACDLKEVRGD